MMPREENCMALEHPMRLAKSARLRRSSPGDALAGRQRALALPVFAAALGLYAATLAPTVTAVFDDSLELQLVTYQLGIAHPTGYPLYTLLGWLFTRLPVGDVAFRVNLMSAVFGAAAVALVYLVTLEATAGQLRSRPRAAILAGLLAALSLAVSPIFWSQATVAEVYTLHAALVAGMLWLLAHAGRPGRTPQRLDLALAFLLGLSLAHHRTSLLLLPAIGWYAWDRVGLWRNHGATGGEGRTQPLEWRRGLKLAAAFCLPLLLYLYIPLRGHAGSLDGNYTHTLAGFWQHVTASGYGVFIFQNPFGTERGPGFYLSLFLDQFGPAGLAAGLVGLAALLRRRSGQWLGVTFIVYVTFNLFYRVADIQVFFIPAFLIWAVWIGAAAGWLMGRLERLLAPGWQPLVSPAVVLLLATQPALLLAHNFASMDRSDDWAVYDYGLDVMRQPLEPGAAVVGILGETTLVRYFQAAHGLRTDLLPVAADREDERLAAVDRLLNEGRAVYLARELPGAAGRWSLSAAGPLIRVQAQPMQTPPKTQFPAGETLIPGLTLHGYSLSRPPRHAGPPPLRLSLAWYVQAPIPRELKVSARLLDAAGAPVAQADAVPVHFAYPTPAWRTGEYILDVYDLDLPVSLPPGDYSPLVILYDPARGAAEVARLPLPPIPLP
jgi:hypothetical protein